MLTTVCRDMSDVPPPPTNIMHTDNSTSNPTLVLMTQRPCGSNSDTASVRILQEIVDRTDACNEA